MQGIDLLSELGAVFFVDIGRKLPLFHSGKMGNSAQVIQDHLLQVSLSDLMRCTVLLSLLAVGIALEMELGALDGLGSVQHHGLTAVSAEDKACEHIELVHMLGRSALMRAHIPNDIPEFLSNQRLMGVLDNDLFALGDVHSGFVLIGDGGTLLQTRVTEIGLILKNVGDRSTAPTIRPLYIHSRLSFPILTVIVMGRCQNLFAFQNTRDLIRTFAAGAQLENALHDGSGFFIGNDILTVCRSFLIAIPLLMIPSAEPRIQDANDWYACFETVRDTFSSRVGQICNAALDRSIIAYNENSDAEERQRCRDETEALAILTGLKIDSVKSGVKPDLTEYLGRRTVKRTPFLQYKKLVEDAKERRAWYEPTHREKLKAFLEKTDWSAVDSNVERLPYIADRLKKNTPKIKPKPALDSKLFKFAVQESWKNTLDMDILLSVRELLQNYEACLSRIRACRASVRDRQKEKDINRILFARGQEEIYDTDELYALFRQLAPERLTALRQAIQNKKWRSLIWQPEKHSC